MEEEQHGEARAQYGTRLIKTLAEQLMPVRSVNAIWITFVNSAYNICNPAGILTEEEVAWSQCFMGICSYVNKMTATEHDTESMNRHVEQMVQEAILASGVERVMNEGVEENIFSDLFAKEVDEIKMPFTKFQILSWL